MVVLAVSVFVIVRDRHALGTAFREIGWAPMVLSAVFAVVGTVLLFGLWMAVLGALGAKVPMRHAWAVFFVSQLGKYLPGLVWPALAQMEAGRRWGVRRTTMLTGNLLMIAVLTSSGAAAGLVLLPDATGLKGVTGVLAWIAAAALLVVCVWPRLLTLVIDLAFALARRDAPRLSVSPSGMLISFAWAFVTWIVYGLHVWVLVRAVGGTGAHVWVVSTGAIALGWALGLVAVLAPAGVGVRDGVLIAVLAPLAGRTPALAVALASRGLLALADVVLAAAGAWSGARRSVSDMAQE